MKYFAKMNYDTIKLPGRTKMVTSFGYVFINVNHNVLINMLHIFNFGNFSMYQILQTKYSDEDLRQHYRTSAIIKVAVNQFTSFQSVHQNNRKTKKTLNVCRITSFLR